MAIPCVVRDELASDIDVIDIEVSDDQMGGGEVPSTGMNQATPLWVLEDTANHSVRNAPEGRRATPIALRLYRVEGMNAELAAEETYEPGDLVAKGVGRADLAVRLLDAAGVENGIVVASHRSGGGPTLVRALRGRNCQFVVEISPSARLRFRTPGRPPSEPTPASKLKRAGWTSVDPKPPHGSSAVFTAAYLGRVRYGGVDSLECFAVSSGGIRGDRRGLLVGVASLAGERPLDELAHILGWIRWVRLLARRAERQLPEPVTNGSQREPSVRTTCEQQQLVLSLPVRANLQIARRLDEQHAAERSTDLFSIPSLRGRLTAERRILNVVELFAGAGGMGLGFLLAKKQNGRAYRVIVSGEIHPVYVHTLRHNHRYLLQHNLVEHNAVPDSTEALDLRTANAADSIRAATRNAGGVDVLIGGPPCQGFSNANRNSWSSDNPNNKLIDTYIDYVELLRPRVLLMENVQGILWTARGGGESSDLSVAQHVVARLSAAGYLLYPKLLDAAWYGVPQHRNRFFLLGVHRDVGYEREDFGAWGPYPGPTHGPGTARKYAWVEDAIRDLPEIKNGGGASELPYVPAPPVDPLLSFFRQGAPDGIIWDHIASRHADYVIERYRRIPPGENWQSVVDMMTNYANVERTHSNIYRRLRWREVSITIGHYRKSMIVHPSQDRGLSLREAARLQSFPDWFRFAGSEKELDGGLTFKQQQLANAVCPLVTKAVAEFVLDL